MELVEHFAGENWIGQTFCRMVGNWSNFLWVQKGLLKPSVEVGGTGETFWM